MNKNYLLKLSEFLDERIDLGDYTVEQLEEMLSMYETDKENFKQKYFEKYDDVKHFSLKKQDW